MLLLVIYIVGFCTNALQISDKGIYYFLFMPNDYPIHCIYNDISILPPVICISAPVHWCSLEYSSKKTL
jgi:hypothetical protein